MGLFSVLATIATAVLLVFGQPALVAAQTVTPVTPSSTEASQGIYFYNPVTRDIISPSEYSNELSMVSYEYYNESMSWKLSSAGSIYYYISSVDSTTAGCSSGAYWSASNPVVTVCGTGQSTDTSFEFVQTSKGYAIFPESSTGCVVNNKGTVSIPPTQCNVQGAFAQWQLVTISS
jgi:hypothetical protein